MNSFTLAAQAVNPKITTKLVMIDSWFDPAKEAAAVQTLANLGCDVIAQHTDSPAGLQVCEQRKVWCFGQGADMSRFAPKTQATAIEDIWGPYYISRAKAMLDGSWKPDDAWWGFKEGTVVISPYNKALPDDVKRRRRQDHRRLEGRLLRRLHRPDRGPDRQGARRQGRAHEGQGPRGHRLVREGRAELSLANLSPCEMLASPHPVEGGRAERDSLCVRRDARASRSPRSAGRVHAASSCTLASGHTRLAISARCRWWVK